MNNNYEINKETLIIFPQENNKSFIKEKETELIIYLSPIKIINESCLYFGSSYLGRLESTKKLFGYSKKAPIIIEESNNIIFFPLESPRLASCIWISLNNIKEYYKIKDKTKVIFSCGKQEILPISYFSFDNQILRANRLLTFLLKKQQKNR